MNKLITVKGMGSVSAKPESKRHTLSNQQYQQIEIPKTINIKAL